MERSFYQILGVSKGADERQIAKAYRKMARTCHPDLHPDDENKAAEFLRVKSAYKTLSDPDLRKQYDKTLRPPGSVWDLFSSVNGKRFLTTMLPSAKMAKVPGPNTFLALRTTGADDGKVTLDLPEVGHPIELQHTPGQAWSWHRVHGLGEPGINGGRRGDLYVLVTKGDYS